jgi:hypothetical protein
MNKKVSKSKEESKAIVSWEDMMKTEAKDVAKTERPSVGRISLQSGIMTYQDQVVPDNTLECIIAAVIHEQVYYDKPYVPGVVNPPGCFAFAPVGDLIKAHPDVGERDYGPDCITCSRNQWGTATRDGVATRGKACSDRRKLAILPRLESIEDYANAEIAILSIPVMSVKNWANYVNLIAAQQQRPSWGLFTRIIVKPDPKSQFKVYFEIAGILDDEHLAAVHPRIEMCVDTLNVPYDMTPVAEEKEEASGKY